MAQRPLEQHRARSSSKRMVKYPTSRDLETRYLIVTKYFGDGDTEEEIADNLDVGIGSVSKYVQLFLDTGDVFTEPEILFNETGKWFQRPKLTDDDAIKHVLMNAIADDPTMTLRAYQSLLRDFGVFISLKTIDNWWRSQNITFKKISAIAKESTDEEIETFWQIFLTIYTSLEQLLWGDESHRDAKTVNPKYGRAPRDRRCVWPVQFVREYKLSLILFNDAKNAVAHKIVSGPVNEDIFNEFFMDEVITQVEPYPGKHSIIMIDNVPFHHNINLQECVDAANAILLFLPSYKAEYNLSEYWFNGIKGKERSKRVYGDEALAAESIEQSIEEMQDKSWDSILRDLGYIV